MNKITVLSSVLVLVLFSFSAVSPAEEDTTSQKKVKWVKSKTGIKSLMVLSKDMGQMKKELTEETRNYQNILKAADGDLLKEGERSFEIEKKYGEPVLVLDEPQYNRTRWVYKPGTSSYFEGEKVYLLSLIHI